MTGAEHHKQGVHRFLGHHPGWWVLVATLLTLTAVGLRIGWRHQRMRSLVEQLEAFEVQLTYAPFGPAWLHEIVGEQRLEPLAHPVRLVVLDERFGDHEFQSLVIPLNELQEIHYLSLEGTQVTELGLERIIEFRKLEVLCIAHSEMGDEAVERIGGLAELESLQLSDLPITDLSLRHLSRLNKLSSLYLDGTQITDEGLKHLSSLKNLSDLSVSNTNVTDTGLEELQRHLTKLQISDD